MMRALFDFEVVLHVNLSVGFPYFTNVFQFLCSLSGWLHLNCSSLVLDLMEPKAVAEVHTI